MIRTVLCKLDDRWDKTRISEKRVDLRSDGRSLLVEVGYTPRPRAGLASTWETQGPADNGFQLWVAR